MLVAMSDVLEPLPSLTRRQEEILMFVGHTYARRRQAPLLTEIREHLGLSKRTNIEPYLLPLYEKGYLLSGPRFGRRALQLTPLAIEMLAVLLKEEAPDHDLNELIQKFRAQDQ